MQHTRQSSVQNEASAAGRVYVLKITVVMSNFFLRGLYGNTLYREQRVREEVGEGRKIYGLGKCWLQ